MKAVNDSANNAPAAASTTTDTSLRQLSRDYSDGKLAFNEYRRLRAELLDGIVRRTVALQPFQPPPPPRAARIATSSQSTPDVEPTLRIRRPSPARRLWVVVLLAALLIVAIVAGLKS
jgi:hypothetical protein